MPPVIFQAVHSADQVSIQRDGRSERVRFRSVATMFTMKIWAAAVGEELSCVREADNHRDPFTVAVVKFVVTVGHVDISVACCAEVSAIVELG